MIFLIPENDTPFSSDDYHSLSDDFLRWFASVTIGEENVKAQRMDYLRNILSRLNVVAEKNQEDPILIYWFSFSFSY